MKKVSILLVIVLVIGVVLYWGSIDKTSEDKLIESSGENSQLGNKDNEGREEDIEKDEDVKKENENLNSKEQNTLTEEDLVRRDGQGSVNVAVALTNVLADDPETLIFKMYLNTHSVALDEINYTEIASVKVDGEITIKEGFKWEVGGGSGHHIWGYLTVPKEYNGNKLFDENTQSIELELRNIGDIPLKTFAWDLKEFKK